MEHGGGVMRLRDVAVIGVLAAAGMAGLLFGPVFTVGTLWPPVLVALVVVALVDTITRRPSGAGFRFPLAVLLGIGAVTGVLLVLDGGGSFFGTIANGLVNGWRQTLGTTWPARPEPGLVLFVPALVTLAAALGVEILRRDAGAGLAVLPSLVVVGIAQLYQPVSDATAAWTGLGWAVTAAVVLVATRATATRDDRTRDTGIAVGRGGLAIALPAVVTVSALVVGAVVITDLAPQGRPAYLLAAHEQPPRPPDNLSNPLDDLSARLADPNAVAFRVDTDESVDRWTVADLDGFDGVNWTTNARFQTLGRALSGDPSVRVPTTSATATITLGPATGRWLPTQSRTRSVTGLSPLVDPATGTLLDDSVAEGQRYQLTWQAPDVAPSALQNATLGTDPGQDDLGQVPAGLTDLAKKAVGNLLPSFQTALVLEDWFRRDYRLATGRDLPSGHGYPQLLAFLNGTKRGTSEQFAAAYVVLARLVGIPARLAVGFRAPAASPGRPYVVRDADAFAWPEVLVAGVGWIPLDPSGTITSGRARRGSIAHALHQAQAQVPPSGQIHQQFTAPPVRGHTRPPRATGWSWFALLWLLPLLVLATPVTVVVAKLARRRSRRRGSPQRAVLGAWWEARDRLRDHGVMVHSGMTVRDLAAATMRLLGPDADPALHDLSRCVDQTLWSGEPVSADAAAAAWLAVGNVRTVLSRRPWPVRLTGMFTVRGLRRLPD